MAAPPFIEIRNRVLIGVTLTAAAGTAGVPPAAAVQLPKRLNRASSRLRLSGSASGSALLLPARRRRSREAVAPTPESRGSFRREPLAQLLIAACPAVFRKVPEVTPARELRGIKLPSTALELPEVCGAHQFAAGIFRRIDSLAGM